MSNEIYVRKIEESDAASIAALRIDLGYGDRLDESEDLVRKQISTINAQNDHFMYAAVVDNEVVGFIHAFLSIRLTSETFLEIGGLVVSEAFRQRGIGGKLVTFLEEQTEITTNARVRCNAQRRSAHAFYNSLGYSEVKDQKIFDKKLEQKQLINDNRNQ
jgi:GNAT superfamily N-acetyltransferase